jgi:hypothetical protein
MLKECRLVTNTEMGVIDMARYRTSFSLSQKYSEVQFTIIQISINISYKENESLLSQRTKRKCIFIYAESIKTEITRFL